MIDKRTFTSVCKDLQSYWKSYKRFEDLLGVQIESNWMTDCFDNTVKNLVWSFFPDADRLPQTGEFIESVLYLFFIDEKFGEDTVEERTWEMSLIDESNAKVPPLFWADIEDEKYGLMRKEFFSETLEELYEDLRFVAENKSTIEYHFYNEID